MLQKEINDIKEDVARILATNRLKQGDIQALIDCDGARRPARQFQSEKHSYQVVMNFSPSPAALAARARLLIA